MFEPSKPAIAPASQQWAVPCIGGILYHSVAGHVVLLGFDEDSFSAYLTSFVKSFARASSTEQQSSAAEYRE